VLVTAPWLPPLQSANSSAAPATAANTTVSLGRKNPTVQPPIPPILTGRPSGRPVNREISARTR
jgi:hypothetical protein